MKRKIGILTFYYKNRNYGGLLQAYAMQKSIEKLYTDCQCEQIAYELSKTPLMDKLKNAVKYKPFFEVLRMCIYDMGVKRVMSLLFDRKIIDLTKERGNSCRHFENTIPHSGNVYNYKTIGNCADLYDAYVVGSDQIWNAGVDLETFLLKHVPNNKRKISYAASSGGIVFKGKQKKVIAAELKNFDAISVREESLGKQLKGLCGTEIQNVIDPVFLLSKEEWETVAIPPKNDEPYILCYLLGTSTKQRKVVEETCKRKGYKLVVFPYIVNNSFRICDWKFGEIRDYSAGPEEFLGLIKNAQAIITDSFHAVAFSVIFRKTFCVLPRYQNGKVSKTNNRLYDFLKKLNLEERIGDERYRIIKLLDSPVHFDEISNSLNKWIDESRLWLLTNIKQ